jgi:hypothetical protein
LNVRHGGVTIAGETAPAKGILITQYGLYIGAENVIVRHLRVRPGDARKGSTAENGFNGDAMSINASRVIVVCPDLAPQAERVWLRIMIDHDLGHRF